MTGSIQITVLRPVMPCSFVDGIGVLEEPSGSSFRVHGVSGLIETLESVYQYIRCDIPADRNEKHLVCVLQHILLRITNLDRIVQFNIKNETHA